MTVGGIAAAAGVSVGAVSSVMNNRHIERRISEETVRKVREAAARLGYLPNISARRLRARGDERHALVLALVTSFEAPLSLANHFLLALRAQFDAARGRAGGPAFSLLIEMFAAGRLRHMPGLLTGDHFNAAIIMNTVPADDAWLARSHLPYPVVLVNRAIAGYACVLEDPDSGGSAAHELWRGKRRRLGVLHGKPLTQTTQARVDSFMKTAAELTGQPAREITAERLTEGAASDAMAAFLRRGGRIDGLYTVTDGLALGAYHAIKEAGLAIPDDIAVVGVGDHENSAYFDPALSCVGVSHQRLGEEAARLLLRRLTKPAEAPAKLEIPVEPQVRRSSGRAG